MQRPRHEKDAESVEIDEMEETVRLLQEHLKIAKERAAQASRKRELREKISRMKEEIKSYSDLEEEIFMSEERGSDVPPVLTPHYEPVVYARDVTRATAATGRVEAWIAELEQDRSSCVSTPISVPGLAMRHGDVEARSIISESRYYDTQKQNATHPAKSDLKPRFTRSQRFTGEAGFAGETRPRFTGEAGFAGETSSRFTGEAGFAGETRQRFTGEAGFAGETRPRFAGEAGFAGETSSRFAGETRQRFTGEAGFAGETRPRFAGEAGFAGETSSRFTGEAGYAGETRQRFTGEAGFARETRPRFTGEEEFARETGLVRETRLRSTGEPGFTGEPRSTEEARFTGEAGNTCETKATLPKQTVDTKTPTNDLLVTLLDKLVTFQRESTLSTPEVDPFDGSDIIQFPTFLRTFTTIVEDVTRDDKRRLEMLLKYTKGEAKQLIKDCIFIEDTQQAYMTAMKLLKANYGQSSLLAAKYKEKAEQWNQIKPGDNAALKKYAVFLTGLRNARMGTADLDNVDSYEFLKILASKLPRVRQQHWIKIVGKCRDEENRNPKFEDFQQFVNKTSRDENDPRIAGLGYQGCQNKTESKRQKGQAFATAVITEDQKSTNKKRSQSCMYCGPDTKHVVLDCRKFKALQPAEKSEVCKSKGLCYGCLKTGHTKRQCKSPEKCSTCHRKHPTALHDPNRDQQQSKRESKHENNSEKTVPVTTGCVGTRNKGPFMAIVPVLVKATAGSQSVATYAFMDNGCGAVFAAEELCRKLHTRTRKVKLTLRTLNKEETINTNEVQDQLQVADIDGNKFLNLPSVYVKDVMPVAHQDIPLFQKT